MLPILICLGGAAPVLAGSKAYVQATSAGPTYVTPGSIAPVNLTTGQLGTQYFAPLGGNLVVVTPGGTELWVATQGIGCPGCGPYSIYVLDPKTGAQLGAIPVTSIVASIVFDPRGNLAYACLPALGIAQIDVARRKILQTASYAGCTAMALSADGSALFTGFPSELLVLNTSSLAFIKATIPVPSFSIFVSGATLLVTTNDPLEPDYLIYFDLASLKRMKAVHVPLLSRVFAVSPDHANIYLSYLSGSCGCVGPANIAVLDFATGKTLTSQSFSGAGSSSTYSLLTPDGAHLLVVGNVVLLVDPQTLTTTGIIVSAGTANGAAFLDSSTLVLLYSSAAAMMVVDQLSAQLTATFPAGESLGIGEAADLARGAIYCGGGPGGNTAVVSTNLNRVVSYLSTAQFAPKAVAGDQVFQVYSTPDAYNLTTGVLNVLPEPASPPGSRAYYSGGLPPKLASFWAGFTDFNAVSTAVASGFVVYSTTNDTIIGQFITPTTTYPQPIVFSPDSSTAYIAETNAIAVYDTATLQKVTTYDYTTTLIALAISPDGSTLYASNGSAAFFLDAATGMLKQQVSLPAAVEGNIAVSLDGATLFILSPVANAVDLVDTATGQVTAVPVPYPPTSVVVMP